ncbi:MAG: ABC transporter ATP-binding protein [Bacteroidota bacterium]|nr:ABC transporter ATP-binding protein [Bacteroidota bacterium]MDX5428144.1 ABC transporter ATP-binding protein [Bacteroidota bacterium]MDX5449039.1 ABC transporter ATP-binding protein [Bacteroidota bacterium]MDX5505947.1 ABC transporter ATP-binding protein [Bacteroidota bacterium]
MSEIMVNVEELGKSYGSTRALDELSFSTKKGEIFGLIGPDGAGKSTAFRIITTLLLPDHGKVTFDGVDVVKDYRHVRRNVGYMPGTFSLYQDLSVEENLRFFATVFNTSIKENYDLIRDIYQQIEPFKKRKAGALSGGMKQKLALSCALIHRPKVLVLDEPTTGVDVVSRREFWKMLGDLKEQGLSILVSTPYMDEAEQCDRVALLQEGRILESGTPSEVTDRFEGELYGVWGKEKYRILQELTKSKGVDHAFPFGENIHVFQAKGQDTSSWKHKLDQSFESLRVEKIRPNIEDRFMQLMNLEDE